MPKFRIKPKYTEASDGDVLVACEPPSPSPSPTESDQSPPPVKEKKKRELSEKQLEALAKGRAKVAENRLHKQKKEDSKFCEDGILQKKKQKDKKKRTINEQKHYDRLKEKEASFVPTKNPHQHKFDEWTSLREEWLGKTTNSSDFEELSQQLDTITEEDIIDGDKLVNKLNKMLDNYKE